MKNIKMSILVIAALSITGCRSAYYKTMEAFGQHKRDLLVNRVENARDAQAVASLHNELASVETDIATLIKEMEASIAEADEFINAMAGT